MVGFQGGRAWGQLGDEGRVGAAGTPGKGGEASEQFEGEAKHGGGFASQGQITRHRGKKEVVFSGGGSESGDRRVGHGSGPEGKRQGEGGGHENVAREWWARGRDEDEAVKKWPQFLKHVPN